MSKLELGIDEVILLEEGTVSYCGSLKKVNSFERLFLTNKRIVALYRDLRGEKSFSILPREIKRYNDQYQVDCYYNQKIGECLRIQTINGIELFKIGARTEESLTDSIKNIFFNKRTENERINLWIDKIREAFESVKSEPIISVPKPTPINEKPKSDEGSFFCIKCGQKLSIGTKFCTSCGTPVVQEQKPEKTEPPAIPKQKENRENKIQKCPVCGEILAYDAITCPSCGHEVRNREAAVSVQSFFDRISSIQDEKKKIETIKMYVIPNDKEDIMEFMILATTNFDAKLYATNKQVETIASAWRTKIEQCYKKAMLLFTDEKDIQRIKKLYKETKIKTKVITYSKWLLIILGVVLIIASFALIGTAPRETAPDGTTTSFGVQAYVGLGCLPLGIISLVFGIIKKKNSK